MSGRAIPSQGRRIDLSAVTSVPVGLSNFPRCHKLSFRKVRWSSETSKLLKTPFSGCSPHIIPTSFDGIHPNEKGYAIVGPLAQAVIDKTLWK
jgi:lysophospholipase L1-like esterase